jgi:hypothetical protein
MLRAESTADAPSGCVLCEPREQLAKTYKGRTELELKVLVEHESKETELKLLCRELQTEERKRD